VAGDDPQQPRRVLGLGDDVDRALAQQRDDALAQQRVVLDDHDAHGSSARIVVGPPAGLVTLSAPSIASTRWRRPVSPPPRRSAPRPTTTRAGAPPAFLATFVSASATTK